MSEGTENQQPSPDTTINYGDIDEIYFNEFAIEVSKHDVSILLRRNGKEATILNASHITAKALFSCLGEVLEKFEKQTHQTIPNSDELENLMEDSES